MAKAIFDVFFSIIQTALNLILAPINPLIDTLIPDFTDQINTFNTLIYTYIGDGVAWFSSILPSTTRSMILLYLSFLLGYYTISYSVHAFIKIFKLIKAIKFW